MSKNSTINLRVNSEIKKEAGEILNNLGLTFSEAFNLLLHQVKLSGSLPFPITTHYYSPKPETLEIIERIERGEEEMLGPFATFEEYKASLEEEDDE